MHRILIGSCSTSAAYTSDEFLEIASGVAGDDRSLTLLVEDADLGRNTGGFVHAHLCPVSTRSCGLRRRPISHARVCPVTTQSCQRQRQRRRCFFPISSVLGLDVSDLSDWIQAVTVPCYKTGICSTEFQNQPSPYGVIFLLQEIIPILLKRMTSMPNRV